ncbi:hypothetical protein PAL_GLEAN10017917 [Pteropus alecto]|uniref:Uncharacterized protein n=1 Tax=Pteropus alecto TaxID=9402 RepID=L5KYU2_PTEAL|nr:hypothetical protein PAL_GLEAN10017917 [Pteropus alecto]
MWPFLQPALVSTSAPPPRARGLAVRKQWQWWPSQHPPDTPTCTPNRGDIRGYKSPTGKVVSYLSEKGTQKAGGKQTERHILHIDQPLECPLSHQHGHPANRTPSSHDPSGTNPKHSAVTALPTGPAAYGSRPSPRGAWRCGMRQRTCPVCATHQILDQQPLSHATVHMNTGQPNGGASAQPHRANGAVGGLGHRTPGTRAPSTGAETGQRETRPPRCPADVQAEQARQEDSAGPSELGHRKAATTQGTTCPLEP